MKFWSKDGCDLFHLYFTLLRNKVVQILNLMKYLAQNELLGQKWLFNSAVNRFQFYNNYYGNKHHEVVIMLLLFCVNNTVLLRDRKRRTAQAPHPRLRDFRVDFWCPKKSPKKDVFCKKNFQNLFQKIFKEGNLGWRSPSPPPPTASWTWN